MDHPGNGKGMRNEPRVSRTGREALMGHKGATVWFTGLSASGKSTAAVLTDRLLTARGVHCTVLDGDEVRRGLSRDLGFSPADRRENIRRAGEICGLLTRAGIVVLSAFISPYQADRDRNRAMQAAGDFVEVFVDCPLEICEARDPKGLYRRARAGEIADFTGVSAPYEPPERPELVLHTGRERPEQSAAQVVAYLEEHGYLIAPR